MDGIVKYLLCVTSAAIVCAIISTLPISTGAVKVTIKLVCGLFLCYCFISPVVKLDKFDFSALTGDIVDEAAAFVDEGETMAANAISEIILDRTRAYILDKATELGLDVDVTVFLSGDDMPQPYTVAIKGAVSPYARTILSEYLEKDLGVPKENQLWQ